MECIRSSAFKRATAFAVLGLCLLFAACGDTNPLLGTWHLDVDNQSFYVRLGLSAATSGQSVTVVFKEEEMIVNYGRGAETIKAVYKRDENTKTWSFCINDGKSCHPAVFNDEKKNSVSFPLYGINLTFKRQFD
jgi:hypothetical protein